MSSEFNVPDQVWEERYKWLRKTEESYQHPLASYLLSSKGTFITYDLELAFCAGAWVSVIVLAHAAIDATIRDVESGDYKSNSKVAFDGDPDLEWLRKTRNALVHTDEDYETEDFDDPQSYHDSLEEDAEKAMLLVYRTIFRSPGT